MTSITKDADISISLWQNLKHIFFLLITNWLVPNWGRSTKLYIALFNLYAEYIIWNIILDESQAGIKLSRRNINLSYADDTTLMEVSEEKLKSLLMKVKEKSERAGLKFSIKKKNPTKIMMTFSPITSWQIEG